MSMPSSLPIVEVETYLPDFYKFLEGLGNNNNTIDVKKKHLDYFLKSIPNFSEESIDLFIKKLKSEGKSTSYLNHFIYLSRELARFFTQKNLMKNEKIENFPHFVKKMGLAIGSLTAEEVGKILLARNDSHIQQEQARRWDLFFSIICYSGMYPSEVASLTRENINIENMTITPTNAGSLKKRSIPLISLLHKDLIYFYNKANNHPTKLLFPRKQQLELPESRENWFYEFSKRLRLIGLSREEISKRKLRTMSLRRFYIEECLDNNIDILAIKILAGHGDIRTTNQYIKNKKPNIKIGSQINTIFRKS